MKYKIENIRSSILLKSNNDIDSYRLLTCIDEINTIIANIRDVEHDTNRWLNDLVSIISEFYPIILSKRSPNQGSSEVLNDSYRVTSYDKGIFEILISGFTILFIKEAGTPTAEFAGEIQKLIEFTHHSPLYAFSQFRLLWLKFTNQ